MNPEFLPLSVKALSKFEFVLEMSEMHCKLSCVTYQLHQPEKPIHEAFASLSQTSA